MKVWKLCVIIFYSFKTNAKNYEVFLFFFSLDVIKWFSQEEILFPINLLGI